MHDRLHHRAAGVHDLCEIGAAAVGVGAPRGELLEVMAGAEGRAVGREHDGTDALVSADIVQRSVQLADQALGEAVAGRGAIERQ
ncbi:hypothetical protein ACVIF9_007743 [Bradyrhizobium sp. USDA 4350]